MAKNVTFFGPTNDQYGMPLPYNGYLIFEGTADWLPAGAFAAVIHPLTAAPVPTPRIYTSVQTQAAATEKVITALADMPENKGLRKLMTS